MLDRTNGTLLRVRDATAATGGRDDWDDARAPAAGPDDEPTGSGAVKAEGPWRVYVRETVDRVADGGAVTVTARRVLYLPADELASVDVDTDDVLEVTLDAGGTITGTAQAITRNRTPGLPGIVRSARIDLRSD